MTRKEGMEEAEGKMSKDEENKEWKERMQEENEEKRIMVFLNKVMEHGQAISADVVD
jgi:hypothetical protein